MTKRRLIYVLGGVAAIGAMAWAKSDVPNPRWLSDAEINTMVMQEPPPPAAGSAAEKEDMKAELAAQDHRTPAQIAEAMTDNGYSVALFTDAIGPKITPQSDPQTFLFFEQVNKQIGQIVSASKDRWKRPRPYQAHPEIHALFDAGGFSYPSGHSTHSYAFATVLGEVFPGKAAAFLARAHQIAQSRVDAGVHYTSDIREGEVLGKKIAKDLAAKPEFQAELKAVKVELAGKK